MRHRGYLVFYSLLLFLAGFLCGFSYFARIEFKESVVWSIRAIAVVLIFIVLFNPPT
jgi:hypothetical protein